MSQNIALFVTNNKIMKSILLTLLTLITVSSFSQVKGYSFMTGLSAPFYESDQNGFEKGIEDYNVSDIDSGKIFEQTNIMTFSLTDSLFIHTVQLPYQTMTQVYKIIEVYSESVGTSKDYYITVKSGISQMEYDYKFRVSDEGQVLKASIYNHPSQFIESTDGTLYLDVTTFTFNPYLQK